jgi:hypothetical protein
MESTLSNQISLTGASAERAFHSNTSTLKSISQQPQGPRMPPLMIYDRKKSLIFVKQQKDTMSTGQPCPAASKANNYRKKGDVVGQGHRPLGGEQG